MNLTVDTPRTDDAEYRPQVNSDHVAAQISGLLTSLCPRRNQVERRSESRFPFPYLVHLTPVGDDGLTPQGETLVAVGKHLSRRGLGFYHPHPVPHRRMIVSLQATDGQGNKSVVFPYFEVGD